MTKYEFAVDFDAVEAVDIHTHVQLDLRIPPQCLADFQSAFHRRFRAVGKH